MQFLMATNILNGGALVKGLPVLSLQDISMMIYWIKMAK